MPRGRSRGPSLFAGRSCAGCLLRAPAGGADSGRISDDGGDRHHLAPRYPCRRPAACRPKGHARREVQRGRVVGADAHGLGRRADAGRRAASHQHWGAPDHRSSASPDHLGHLRRAGGGCRPGAGARHGRDGPLREDRGVDRRDAAADVRSSARRAVHARRARRDLRPNRQRVPANELGRAAPCARRRAVEWPARARSPHGSWSADQRRSAVQRRPQPPRSRGARVRARRRARVAGWRSCLRPVRTSDRRAGSTSE